MELPKQVTVAIIKPDAVKAGLVDEIIQKVLSSGGGVLPYETDGDACRFFVRSLYRDVGFFKVT